MHLEYKRKCEQDIDKIKEIIINFYNNKKKEEIINGNKYE